MSESSKEGSDLSQGVDTCVLLDDLDDAIECLEASVAEAIGYFEVRLEEESELLRLREELRRRVGIFMKNSA